jgi:hypothetical protein
MLITVKTDIASISSPELLGNVMRFDVSPKLHPAEGRVSPLDLPIIGARVSLKRRRCSSRLVAVSILCGFLPLFDTKLVRWMCRLPVSLYGLGIPPAQFAYLNAQAHGNVAGLLKDRLQRLACDFTMEDNYFAWQAFGRGYDKADRVAVPRYLSRRHYETVKANVDRVEIEHASFTTRLGREPGAGFDGYVLLDAQDRMSHAQMAELWAEITRTAKPGAPGSSSALPATKVRSKRRCLWKFVSVGPTIRKPAAPTWRRTDRRFMAVSISIN